MQINNAWYSRQLSTQIIVETTDGVRHITNLTPMQVLYETDLRDYYGHELLDEEQELLPATMRMYGLDKVTLPCAMRVKFIRLRTGMSQVAFADRYHIPVRSVENWESGKRDCPAYVIDLLEFRVSHDVCAKPC